MVYDETGPGRNDPCPCGSGKKYKKCHGASVPPEPDPIDVTADKPKSPKHGRDAAAASPETETDCRKISITLKIRFAAQSV